MEEKELRLKFGFRPLNDAEQDENIKSKKTFFPRFRCLFGIRWSHRRSLKESSAFHIVPNMWKLNSNFMKPKLENHHSYLF